MTWDTGETGHSRTRQEESLYQAVGPMTKATSAAEVVQTPHGGCNRATGRAKKTRHARLCFHYTTRHRTIILSSNRTNDHSNSCHAGGSTPHGGCNKAPGRARKRHMPDCAPYTTYWQGRHKTPVNRCRTAMAVWPVCG